MVYNGTGQRRQIDHDASVAQVTAALLTGQELGFSPMASLRSIDVIHGTPALRAAALRGLLQAHGHDLWVVETTATRAIVKGRRRGQAEYPTPSTWTIDRAAALRLPSFNNPDGQWRRQPANMLVARASAEMARWIAMDVLLGLPYVVEELEDGEPASPEDGADGQPSQPAAPKRRTARRRPGGQSAPAPGRPRAVAALAPAPEPPQDAADAAPEPTGPSPEGAPPGPQDGPSTADTGDRGAADAEAPPMREAQRRAIWAGLRRLDPEITREGAHARISEWIGREIHTSNALTEADARTVLDAITRAEAKAAAEAARDADAAQQAEDQDWPPEPSHDD
jgi:hypothetical protein